MIYGCTSKSFANQRLAADLSSDLTLTSQWGKNWLVTFHLHRSDSELSPVLMNRWPPRGYWASHPTSSEIPIYDPLLKMQVKWSAPCSTPVSTWLLMRCSTFIGARSGKKLSTVTIFGQELSCFDSVQKRLRVLVEEELLFTLQPLSHVRCGEPLIALLLLPWNVLRWIVSPSSTRFDHHS